MTDATLSREELLSECEEWIIGTGPQTEIHKFVKKVVRYLDTPPKGAAMRSADGVAVELFEAAKDISDHFTNGVAGRIGFGKCERLCNAVAAFLKENGG